MSYLMDHLGDDEAAFERKVRREIRALQRDRKRRMPLWKQIIAYAVIPAVTIWIIGEICLYVHGTVHLRFPASESSRPHVTTTLRPGR